MATQVEVRDSSIASAGRGLFALQDFSPGDVVLRLARPNVAELYFDRMQDTCAWCFLRGATDPYERKASAAQGLPTGFVETKACQGCKKVRYCSKTCQTKAWKREHKYECKVLQPAERPDLPEGVRAVIKLLGRLKADPEGKDEELLEILKFKPSLDADVMETFSKRQPEMFEEWQTMAYAAWKYAGEPVMGETESLPLAKAFYYNTMFNVLTLTAPYNDDAFGTGFDPTFCSANHSCDPNAAVLFNQPETLLRALKPIKKGEEVTMRYIDVTNPRGVRRDELQRKYYFDCNCSKCRLGPTTASETYLHPPEKLAEPFTTVADGLIERHANTLHLYLPPNSDSDPTTPPLRRLAALEAEAFSVSGTSQDQHHHSKQASEPEIKDALKLALNSHMFSYHRQPVPHLLKQLYKYYIATQQRYPAWRVGLKMHFFCQDRNQENFDPERMIDTWALANVTNSLCQPSMSHIRKECLDAGLDLMLVFVGLVLEVHDAMPKAYGRDSPFGRVVQSVYARALQAAPCTEAQLREKVKETWPVLEQVARSVDVLGL